MENNLQCIVADRIHGLCGGAAAANDEEDMDYETDLEQTCGGFGVLCSAGGGAAGRVLCGGRHRRPEQQLCAQLLLSAGAGSADAGGRDDARTGRVRLIRKLHAQIFLYFLAQQMDVGVISQGTVEIVGLQIVVGALFILPAEVVALGHQGQKTGQNRIV